MPAKSKQELALLERDVTRQVKDFLEWKGWRPFRNQVVTSQNQAGGWVRAGEKGMADWLFVRYLEHTKLGVSLSLWIEMKKEGEPLRADQVDWHFKEIHRGGLVITVDKFEPFELWYEETFGWLHKAGGEGQLVLF